MKLHIGTLALFVVPSLARCGTVDYAKCGVPTATVLGGGVLLGTTTRIHGATDVVNQFLGIPFASPPTGTARFSIPQPTNWSGSRHAQKFESSCIQVFSPFDSRDFIQDVFSVPRPSESEDCLYLNVFAPRKRSRSTASYPVMFWLYGGGFKFGNAGQPIYDGSHLAALEDVVVVSVNYRTNVFGFPIAPNIQNLTERNLGLLDQRAGLDWVQRNIKAFNGDPKRVTIFGQSAGAYAVDVLLTSPWPSGPPFRAAIMQSGTYAYNPLNNCNDTNYDAWNLLLNRTNCADTASSFDCLMDTSADDIRYAQEKYGISFGMAGDNITIVCDPRLRREAGKFARVPVIGGSNVDDGSFYAAKSGDDIDRYLSVAFPKEIELKAEILAAYPLGSEGRFDNASILAQIITDWNFHCPAVFLSNSSQRYVPTYRYLFNASFPNQRLTNLPGDLWPVSHQKAYHVSEVPLVFSTYSSTNATVAQNALSDTMRSAWGKFARNPYIPPITGWKVSGVNGSRVMDFGVDGMGKVAMMEDKTGKCEVWKDYIWRKHL